MFPCPRQKEAAQSIQANPAVRCGIVVAGLLVAALAGCRPADDFAGPTSEVQAETARVPSTATPGGAPEAARLSDQMLFLVWYESETQPPPVNELHSWVLHIRTASGEPVEHAVVTVAGDMPEHGHGLPTQPRVTGELGQGRYAVEGMKFSMPGFWVITFDITAGDVHDTATIELTLD
jgi:hypothetical protein